jgi:hypothetical protein
MTSEKEAPKRKSAPCLLFVYLAREAPVAVVLRRGPSDWARLSVWHTDADTFEHGQWIKGRVYERRSDVSADGSLFIAFVRQSGGASREASPSAVLTGPTGTSQVASFSPGTAACLEGLRPASSSRLPTSTTRRRTRRRRPTGRGHGRPLRPEISFRPATRVLVLRPRRFQLRR